MLDILVIYVIIVLYLVGIVEATHREKDYEEREHT